MVSTTVAPNVKRLDVQQLRINATGAIKNLKAFSFSNANVVMLYKNVYVDGIALEAQLYDNDLKYIGTKIVIDTHPFIGSIAISTTTSSNNSFFVAWSTLKKSASDWRIHTRYYNYDDTYNNWNVTEAQSILTLRKNKGAFSLAGTDDGVIISTFSTTYNVIITKYTLDQNQIIQEYYQSDTQCLNYPKNIISKISDIGVMAVAYSAQSAIYLQHFYVINGTSLGEATRIEVKAEELYLDVDEDVTLLGWRESSNGCINREQQYKVQMYLINNTSTTEISEIIQLSRRYNTLLESISLREDQQFSAIFQSEDIKILSIYDDTGKEIYTEEEAEQCPNSDALQSRRFVGASSTNGYKPILFAATVLRACMSSYISKAQRNLESFVGVEGDIGKAAGVLAGAIGLIGTGVLIGAQWGWQEDVKQGLEGLVIAVQASSNVDLMTKLSSVRSSFSEILDGYVVSVNSLLDAAVPVQTGACKEKLIAKSVILQRRGTYHQQVLSYNKTSSLVKLLYQNVNRRSIDLILLSLAPKNNQSVVVRHRFIHQSDLGNQLIAYSIYVPRDGNYKLILQSNNYTPDGKTLPFILEEFTRGAYALSEIGDVAVVAYLDNPYTIKIAKLSISNLALSSSNPVTQNIEVGEPYLLKSSTLSANQYVLVYGTPSNNEIHLQIRNANDLSLQCSTKITKSFSHFALDTYSNTLAIALQDRYTSTPNVYKEAILYKYTNNCVAIGGPSITGQQNYMYLGSSAEKLEYIKLVDNTFTIASFVDQNNKIIKVFKNKDLFRPDQGNNPALYPLKNTMYHKIDSVKLPWVHEENPDCEGTDFYTSFITPAGINTEIFHIVRHEGSYDN